MCEIRPLTRESSLDSNPATRILLRSLLFVAAYYPVTLDVDTFTGKMDWVRRNNQMDPDSRAATQLSLYGRCREVGTILR